MVVPAFRISSVTISADACPSFIIASCTAILCGVAFRPCRFSAVLNVSILIFLELVISLQNIPGGKIRNNLCLGQIKLKNSNLEKPFPGLAHSISRHAGDIPGTAEVLLCKVIDEN